MLLSCKYFIWQNIHRVSFFFLLFLNPVLVLLDSLSGAAALTPFRQGLEQELQLLVLNVHFCFHLHRVELKAVLKHEKTVDRQPFLNELADVGGGQRSPIFDDPHYFLVHDFLHGWLLETDCTEHVLNVFDIGKLDIKGCHLGSKVFGLVEGQVFVVHVLVFVEFVEDLSVLTVLSLVEESHVNRVELLLVFLDCVQVLLFLILSVNEMLELSNVDTHKYGFNDTEQEHLSKAENHKVRANIDHVLKGCIRLLLVNKLIVVNYHRKLHKSTSALFQILQMHKRIEFLVAKSIFINHIILNLIFLCDILVR